MSALDWVTGADRVMFEGRDVPKIVPIRDKATKTVVQYQLVFDVGDEGAVIRVLNAAEVGHVLDAEILRIDRGYNRLDRQIDRHLYGENAHEAAGPKPKARTARLVVLSRMMARHHAQGMVLTREGVEAHRGRMAVDYATWQARIVYGTARPNASQAHHPLPAADTLLEYYRTWRRSRGNPDAFLSFVSRTRTSGLEGKEEVLFVLGILREYASDSEPAKQEIASRAREAVIAENGRLLAAGSADLMRVRSVRTYERWIDLYLDPFEVTMQREGRAAALTKFGTSEGGMPACFPGERVEYDAWEIHLISLAVSREAWLAMSERERANVPRVRRWVIVAIDVASRCILGFSICSAPNGRAALEAMRTCWHDKTYLLRRIGITEATWNFQARHHLVSTDSGTEYGDDPFGGSAFTKSQRRLSISMMTTVAGEPRQRAVIERLFRTAELTFARELPGSTRGSIKAKGERTPVKNACLTDDDLLDVFVAWVAKYHNKKHRSLGDRTPAATWKALTEEPGFDPWTPGPAELREACGMDVQARITDRGIAFAGQSYSSKFVREQRRAPGRDRIAGQDGRVTIRVDPFDLGAISLVADGTFVTVPAVDPAMRGRSLREHATERARKKLEASIEAGGSAATVREAEEARRRIVQASMAAADIGMAGYTQDEVARAALELTMGKGRHEEPFVGRDEWSDPLLGSLPDAADPSEGPATAGPDVPSGLRKYRAAKPGRAARRNTPWSDGE